MWTLSELFWYNWTVYAEWDYDYSYNDTNIENDFWSDYSLEDIVLDVFFILIGLCGMVGNGIVIWLLGFCLKRNHYGVYILNLAIADFTYLSTVIANYTFLYKLFPTNLALFTDTLEVSSYLVGLSLLMAISVERCVSVLWPIWYKCQCPAHLSTIVCTVVWVFFINIAYLITFLVVLEYPMWFLSGLMSLPTILVLFVSSLILFIKIQCYSRQRKPSRLYWSILLNILAFLLLSVPRSVYKVCSLSMVLSVYHFEILFFTTILHFTNSAVNPIIYFFSGRHRQWEARKPLREVLQRALMDEDEESEQRRGMNPKQNMTNVEHQEGAPY